MDRRTLLSAAWAAAVAGTLARRATAQDSHTGFQYPIGWPDRSPGDGFFIRHGYACENTWYNPGYLHTGEDCTGPSASDSHNERRHPDRDRRRLTATPSTAGFTLSFNR